MGKGTQCELLMKNFNNLVHLSAGELLREEIAAGTEMSKLIDDYLKDGKIVPVKISCGLLKKAMEAAGWEVCLKRSKHEIEEGVHHRRISS